MNGSKFIKKLQWSIGNPKINKSSADDYSDYFEYEESKYGNTNKIELSGNTDQSKINYGDRTYWVGTTNFKITKTRFIKLRNINGIEILRVPGTYTFVISAAKLFDEEDIKQKIVQVLDAKSV